MLHTNDRKVKQLYCCYREPLVEKRSSQPRHSPQPKQKALTPSGSVQAERGQEAAGTKPDTSRDPGLRFQEGGRVRDPKAQGEAARAAVGAAASDQEIRVIRKIEIIPEGGHTDQQIFRVDARASRGKKVPSRTFPARQEESMLP